MTTRQPTIISSCSTCGFSLYNPIAALSHSTLGLYDDNRFPGRCILTLNQHFDHFEDIPPHILSSFTQNINTSIQAIKLTTSSKRVNLAILGNAESHVHAHLVPRYPSNETFPQKSPWNDPRPLKPLPPSHKDALLQTLTLHLKPPPNRSTNE